MFSSKPILKHPPFSLLNRAYCFDYFFNITIYAFIICTLKSTKFTLKRLKTLKICPYMFRSIFRPSSEELVDSTLCSYQVEIGWCRLVILLCSIRPHVITVRLCMYVYGVPDWVKPCHRVSPSQVLHIHTQTDGNDVQAHTAQIYNERTSTGLNLVII